MCQLQITLEGRAAFLLDGRPGRFTPPAHALARGAPKITRSNGAVPFDRTGRERCWDAPVLLVICEIPRALLG
jgi:hypothetical protein